MCSLIYAPPDFEIFGIPVYLGTTVGFFSFSAIPFLSGYLLRKDRLSQIFLFLIFLFCSIYYTSLISVIKITGQTNVTFDQIINVGVQYVILPVSLLAFLHFFSGLLLNYVVHTRRFFEIGSKSIFERFIIFSLLSFLIFSTSHILHRIKLINNLSGGDCSDRNHLGFFAHVIGTIHSPMNMFAIVLFLVAMFEIFRSKSKAISWVNNASNR